jgi:hypothetical protein
MAIPVDTDGPTWKVIAVGAVGLVQILFGWLALGFRSTQERHSARLDILERTYVTRDELDRHIVRLEAAGLRMHQDNQNTMGRIEEKLEHGGHTRHGILDGVNAVQLLLKRTLEELRQEREKILNEVRQERGRNKP